MYKPNKMESNQSLENLIAIIKHLAAQVERLEKRIDQQDEEIMLLKDILATHRLQ